ncbi:MAG TPA: Asp-tRNA(Asn)/Glu-tRNA(Gln) amidotransferase subunit GatB [Elusimicrobiota bacterium]|nr:Asp-tRNA(Asn)/Glu-tRNA(Gln) amidotransferase subunit GatB [Elusimicrobiota bacterium]
MEFESVIGLEVHVQIKTRTKIFCGCPTTFGGEPNSQICPVCAGYPGVLPVLNRKVVRELARTALALKARVNSHSIFARKQYFYPDLPKNYQISQYELPLAEKGELSFTLDGQTRTIGIHRIHLEEDAGKLLHAVGNKALNHTLVDLNRTGVPLMEIVSEPDLRTPEEASEYLSTLRTRLRYLDVSDCNMEEGTMRCDANVSIRPRGQTSLGTKAEIKNMNSFKAVRDALSHEIRRQEQAVQAGERIVQETRLWDAARGVTISMRSKEEAHDYRYFPEPDLVPIHLDAAALEDLRKTIPEMPEQKRARYADQWGLSAYDVNVLTENPSLSGYYEETLTSSWPSEQQAEAAKPVANWVTTDLLGRLNAEHIDPADSPLTPARLGELVMLIQDGVISGKIAKTVFDEMWTTGRAAKDIVQAKGLVQVTDEGAIARWADEVISANEKAAREYREGNERAIGALVGAVLKKSAGKANPQLVNKILREKLSSKPS